MYQSWTPQRKVLPNGVQIMLIVTTYQSFYIYNVLKYSSKYGAHQN